MTFQAVAYVWAAVAAALGVVVLHLLARRRPHPRPLPTARFIPERAVRAPALRRRPTDLLVMVLRVIAVLALGLALARPHLPRARAPLAAIVIGDSVPSFSGAFAAALRAAGAQRDDVDAFSLTLAMPLTNDRWDAATPAWRAAWPGRVRLLAVTPRAAPDAVVIWPEVPGGTIARGLVVGDMVAIGSWGEGQLPEGDAVAWFHDGAVAAIERPTPEGCERHVAVGIPDDDAPLGPAFRRIAERLRTARCGMVGADTATLDSTRLDLLVGRGGLVAAADLPGDRAPARPSMVLLLLAVAALGAEQLVRRRAA